MVTEVWPSCRCACLISPAESALSVPALARKSLNWNLLLGTPASSRALSKRLRKASGPNRWPFSLMMRRVLTRESPLFLS